MTSNLGATSLRRRSRPGSAMQSFDALPAPVRRWLSEAALPWSPASARRMWCRAKARGLSVEQALRMLSEAEHRMLARDAQSIANRAPHPDAQTRAL